MPSHMKTYSKKNESKIDSFTAVNDLFAKNIVKRKITRPNAKRKFIIQNLPPRNAPCLLSSDSSIHINVNKDSTFDKLLNGSVYRSVNFKKFTVTSHSNSRCDVSEFSKSACSISSSVQTKSFDEIEEKSKKEFSSLSEESERISVEKFEQTVDVSSWIDKGDKFVSAVSSFIVPAHKEHSKFVVLCEVNSSGDGKSSFTPICSSTFYKKHNVKTKNLSRTFAISSTPVVPVQNKIINDTISPITKSYKVTKIVKIPHDVLQKSYEEIKQWDHVLPESYMSTPKKIPRPKKLIRKSVTKSVKKNLMVSDNPNTDWKLKAKVEVVLDRAIDILGIENSFMCNSWNNRYNCKSSFDEKSPKNNLGRNVKAILDSSVETDSEKDINNGSKNNHIREDSCVISVSSLQSHLYSNVSKLSVSRNLFSSQSCSFNTSTDLSESVLSTCNSNAQFSYSDSFQKSLFKNDPSVQKHKRNLNIDLKSPRLINLRRRQVQVSNVNTRKKDVPIEHHWNRNGKYNANIKINDTKEITHHITTDKFSISNMRLNEQKSSICSVSEYKADINKIKQTDNLSKLSSNCLFVNYIKDESSKKESSKFVKNKFGSAAKINAKQSDGLISSNHRELNESVGCNVDLVNLNDEQNTGAEEYSFEVATPVCIEWSSDFEKSNLNKILGCEEKVDLYLSSDANVNKSDGNKKIILLENKIIRSSTLNRSQLTGNNVRTQEIGAKSIQENEVSFKLPLKCSLKPGKQWRRSLSIFRRESCITNSDHDKYVKKPIISRRVSVRVVPLEEKSSFEDTSSLETYSVNSSYVSKREDDRREDIDGSVAALEESLRGVSILSSNYSRHSSTTRKFQRPITARDVVLEKCAQADVLPFETCYPRKSLQHCQKIGEGVYGEVFLFKNANGVPTVMKIIPVEGSLIVNGEKQKKFEEILSEIVISKALSNLRNGIKNQTSGFSEVRRIHCVQGKYPERLVELWELYDENYHSENDSPDKFDEDQLYIILELQNGGQDLEAFNFNNALQAYALFKHITCALAVAEASLQFEHRDLHWGNVLINSAKNKHASYYLDGKEITLATYGVEMSIIDFTLSRMTCDGVVIYNDLSLDPDLFTADADDYQFEVYRLMQKKNRNEWQHFEPYTNVLWLHYILDKMVSGLRYKNPRSKIHKDYINKLKEIKKEILKYKSAKHVTTDLLLL